MEEVGKGRRQSQKINALSPQFCEGNVEIREVYDQAFKRADV